ncbi:MAG: TetR/AcrR family transcriptional regulator [Spirochaetaceae bacterium]|nr:TetR/AcrR family transcriptional regulator [Spirochaetaceae bacterium]
MSRDVNAKSDRVRLHFAQTGKDMILQSGIESVSARKLAHLAGYALGTIYNHFSSLDELLWYSRSLMIEEMGYYLMTENPGKITGVDDLKKLLRSYMGYFLDNPHIYRFFYFHSLDKKEKRERNFTEAPGFSDQRNIAFSFLSHDGLYSQSEINQIGQILINSIQGLLTMVITDNDGLKAESAYRQLDKMIDFLISDKRKRR